jgi:hypothetical protein
MMRGKINDTSITPKHCQVGFLSIRLSEKNETVVGIMYGSKGSITFNLERMTYGWITPVHEEWTERATSAP